MTHLRVRGGVARRLLVAMIAVLAVVMLATPSATALPGDPCAGSSQTQPWCTFGTTMATGVSFPLNHVLVGDSLLVGSSFGGANQQSWVQGVANNMAARATRTTVVSATPGASWVNYSWAGQQGGNSLLWELAGFLQARIVVVALGTNDARIMTEVPSAYSQQAQYNVMEAAVSRTLQSAPCVVLVNVAKREVTNPTGRMSAANAGKVNANMAALRSKYSQRVFVADWDTRSRNQTSWFQTNNVHLTDLGSMYYYDFIAQQVSYRVASC